MSQLLTFDDVLIVPKFSTITSRKDVSLSTKLGDELLELPIISSNMDTITGPEMCSAMAGAGGIGCLHRFMPVDEMVRIWKERSFSSPMVSIGLGHEELVRAEALYAAGARLFVIDVAHGAQQSVVDQAHELRAQLGDDFYLMVGNFASADSVTEFIQRSHGIDAVKVGIGPGSACTTRIKTGVGYPQFSAIQSIARTLKNTSIQVIGDGGMKTPGDVAKALGAGAHAVMLGGMLSGTTETPPVQAILANPPFDYDAETYLKEKGVNYRGSASHESYIAQGKVGAHRTPEGESFFVPYKGSVINILTDIEGGIRSAMTYVGARSLDEFHARCEFVQVSSATVRENGAHGKT